MPSKLVPERPLIISPTLAATIGLEEAVLLQVLADITAYRQGSISDQLNWVQISDPELVEALPFWTLVDIKRVETSLRGLGMILTQAQTDQPDSYLYAINEKVSGGSQPVAPVVKSPARTQTNVFQPSGNTNYISPDWQPGQEWISQCRQHGIPDEFTLSLVTEFVNYWRERGQTRFSWGNAFYKHVLRSWRQEQTHKGVRELASRMHQDWCPSADAVEILMNAGINQAFIEDAIPEFVLYWQERGVEISTWNTKFIDHIRRQWEKFSSSFGYDDTPRPIAEDWQPSADCFDILQLAEIDEGYAISKVPEFVMYWRDSQQARPSWNTMFLQYIKQDWARRLQSPVNVESDHGDNQSPAEQNQRRVEERLRQLADRSWAENARRW
ncbi:MAG: hypothetical protein JKY98_04545 [Gammaproteobacteria bacterium]|nr:hypothetical protein [Gammaproteobacteria bacterium]